MEKEYKGQKIGNRLIIRDMCVPEDWININQSPPDDMRSYKLTKCLNCGKILPGSLPSLLRYPPKRCVFCSNIGNRQNVKTSTNKWKIYNDYAVCTIKYKDEEVETYIDKQDFEEVQKRQWRISIKRRKYYVVSGTFKKGTMIYLHQLIYGEVKKGIEIDHIDGDSLNNRRSNLRAVTHQENVDNFRNNRTDNKLGIRGVSPDKRNGLYCVDFTHHGDRYYFKPWKTIEEAVWCRHSVEEIFGLSILENNPLFEKYNTLPETQKEEIEQYVKSKVVSYDQNK